MHLIIYLSDIPFAGFHLIRRRSLALRLDLWWWEHINAFNNRARCSKRVEPLRLYLSQALIAFLSNPLDPFNPISPLWIIPIHIHIGLCFCITAHYRFQFPIIGAPRGMQWIHEQIKGKVQNKASQAPNQDICKAFTLAHKSHTFGSAPWLAS